MSNTASASPARFPWRALLYGVVIVYLIADLYWLGGPLRKKIDERNAFTQYSLQQALANGWVATVNREPITRGQLDQATAIYLFRRGKTEADKSDSGLRISRRVALQQLIDDTLVRQYARADEKTFSPNSKIIEKRIHDFKAQFADPAEFQSRLKALGLSSEELYAQLTELSKQEQWLESRIGAAMKITEEDIRDWFDENAATDPGTENPGLIRARHLFLSTVEEDTPEREAQVKEWHRQLNADEVTFEALAAEFSEDERTKHHGGDLGWFGTSRMPKDFSDVVFKLKPGQRSQPFRTSLGWHIVEVTDAREPEALDFDTLKPEIAAWLETERRRYAIQVLMNRLRTVAVMEVFPENFESRVKP